MSSWNSKIGFAATHVFLTVKIGGRAVSMAGFTGVFRNDIFVGLNRSMSEVARLIVGDQEPSVEVPVSYTHLTLPTIYSV